MQTNQTNQTGDNTNAGRDVNINIQEIVDSIHSEIKGLKNNIDEIKRKSTKKIPKWVCWVWLVSVIALALSTASLFIRIDYKWNVELVSTTIALAFVGILATFTVVSNYMQVKNVEDKVLRLEDKVTQIEKQISDLIFKIGFDDAKLRSEIISAVSDTSKDFNRYVSRLLKNHRNDASRNSD